MRPCSSASRDGRDEVQRRWDDQNGFRLPFLRPSAWTWSSRATTCGPNGCALSNWTGAAITPSTAEPVSVSSCACWAAVRGGG